MPNPSALGERSVRAHEAPPDRELAEKRAAEAMAEKLRREADRFLQARPREERPSAS